MTQIDRETIAAMIPHAGEMCLLDTVTSWTETTIRCISHRFRSPTNPLRRAGGTLGAATGIEIAAQAMALHGALLAGPSTRPTQGYLASLRDIRLATPNLDAFSGDLNIEAQKLLGDSTGATYRFTLTCSATELLSGRATVLLGIGA